jgi:universal stress protein E
MPITIERVLVATDFSKAGQRAVDVAAEWARGTHAQLRIVHVTPSKGWLSGTWGLGRGIVDSIQRQAADALKAAAEKADPSRVIELSTAVLSGPAARGIARAARDYRADLVVVGARGERDAAGEQALGGTSTKLLSTTPAPLLLVRGTRKDPVAGVVAALDLSPHASTVLEWADFAAAGRHLYAYHVYEAPFAARFEAYGLSAAAIDVYSEKAVKQRETDLAGLVNSIGRSGITSCAVESGTPSTLLRRYIETVRPSLVVIGKHARHRRSSRENAVGNLCRFVATTASADVLAV